MTNQVHELDVIKELVVNPNVPDGSLDNFWRQLSVQRVVKLTRRADVNISTAS
jgi:hypothetical protein